MHTLLANFLLHKCAKNYVNWLTCVKVMSEDKVVPFLLRHSVEQVTLTGQHEHNVTSYKASLALQNINNSDVSNGQTH